MLTGAFVGSTPEYYPRADAFERWLGHSFALQPIFVTWNDAQDPLSSVVDTQLPAIWTAGRTPMLTWEPFTHTPSETPTDIDQRIARGDFTTHLDRWASALTNWLAGPDGELGTDDDRQLYLRLAHEANGDWYPWAPANGTRPDDYIQMWRTVHRALMSTDLTSEHIQWVWAVNHVDVGDVPAEALYPGDEFVDWVGIDGFNWGQSQPWSTWQSPNAVFDEMLTRLQTLTTKPICIPEYACSSETENGYDVAVKNQWIRDAGQYFQDQPVEMALWFNIDKETDWAVFDAERGDLRLTIANTEYTAYSAYQRLITTLS